jgi:hypothetical protein
MGHFVEGGSMVRHEDAGVGGTMKYEKKDQEYAGKSHDNLLAYGGGKVLSPLHTNKLNELMVKLITTRKLTPQRGLFKG